jgi:hypothetical protein
MIQNISFDEMQKALAEDGIVNIPLLSESEIDELRSAFHETSENISERKFHSTMFVNDADYRKSVDEKIRKIILPKIQNHFSDYRMLFANFIVKESSSETGVDIHQDWNFTSPEFISFNIWIPLIDINQQTGLFHALRGSHRTFQNIRYTPYKENAYAGLRDFILKNADEFYVNAGSALIYHGALVHFSEPNISNRPRIAVGCSLIPKQASNLHYYKRFTDKKVLEIYEVNDAFYNKFDFFDEPKGVTKVGELNNYPELPALNELTRAEIK